ncbi:MAG TPA: NIPSNAP family protein [Steroidobacteraceae bacterium]|nr:NIPSNAP family protein [Steroidobacteraceae bacterium]
MAQRLLEVRTYRLKPGAGPELHDAFIRKGIPLVKQAGMDVVAFGFSAEDPNGYFLMRAFADLHDRKATEDAFYSSDAWRIGPRQSIIAHIDSYQDTLLWLSAEAVEQLRQELAAASRP